MLAKVPETKHEKLGGVVRKVFSRVGTIAEDGLTHPFDGAAGLTKGFAFVNFVNPQDAKQAVATLNGWQLDKSHNIKVNKFKPESPRRTVDGQSLGTAGINISAVPRTSSVLGALSWHLGVT